MLVILNVLLWGTYFHYGVPFDEVVLFSLFLLGMTLFFRITSYMLYERYLASNVTNMNDKRVK